jgi:transglutaminase-like putative cysteine protease
MAAGSAAAPTHAWLEVYFPGAGWMEFDRTNGIIGNRDLIRVAVGARAAPGRAACRHLDRRSRRPVGMDTEVSVNSNGHSPG